MRQVTAATPNLCLVKNKKIDAAWRRPSAGDFPGASRGSQERKYKSDFCQTNPILPQAQQTKTHPSAVTVYSCSAWAGVFFARPAALRGADDRSMSSANLPAQLSSTPHENAKQTQFLLKINKPRHLSAVTIYFRKKPICRSVPFESTAVPSFAATMSRSARSMAETCGFSILLMSKLRASNTLTFDLSSSMLNG